MTDLQAEKKLVFGLMNEESTKSFQDSLFIALNLFNNHEWYEAHDAFEEIWNSVDGDERQVIQGILQVAVSQFHLSKGNFNGSNFALRKWISFPSLMLIINPGEFSLTFFAHSIPFFAA